MSKKNNDDHNKNINNKKSKDDFIKKASIWFDEQVTSSDSLTTIKTAGKKDDFLEVAEKLRHNEVVGESTGQNKDILQSQNSQNKIKTENEENEKNKEIFILELNKQSLSSRNSKPEIIEKANNKEFDDLLKQNQERKIEKDSKEMLISEQLLKQVLGELEDKYQKPKIDQINNDKEKAIHITDVGNIEEKVNKVLSENDLIKDVSYHKDIVDLGRGLINPVEDKFVVNSLFTEEKILATKDKLQSYYAKLQLPETITNLDDYLANILSENDKLIIKDRKNKEQELQIEQNIDIYFKNQITNIQDLSKLYSYDQLITIHNRIDKNNVVSYINSAFLPINIKIDDKSKFEQEIYKKIEGYNILLKGHFLEYFYDNLLELFNTRLIDQNDNKKQQYLISDDEVIDYIGELSDLAVNKKKDRGFYINSIDKLVQILEQTGRAKNILSKIKYEKIRTIILLMINHPLADNKESEEGKNKELPKSLKIILLSLGKKLNKFLDNLVNNATKNDQNGDDFVDSKSYLSLYQTAICFDIISEHSEELLFDYLMGLSKKDNVKLNKLFKRILDHNELSFILGRCLIRFDNKGLWEIFKKELNEENRKKCELLLAYMRELELAKGVSVTKMQLPMSDIGMRMLMNKVGSIDNLKRFFDKLPVESKILFLSVLSKSELKQIFPSDMERGKLVNDMMLSPNLKEKIAYLFASDDKNFYTNQLRFRFGDMGNLYSDINDEIKKNIKKPFEKDPFSNLDDKEKNSPELLSNKKKSSLEEDLDKLEKDRTLLEKGQQEKIEKTKSEMKQIEKDRSDKMTQEKLLLEQRAQADTQSQQALLKQTMDDLISRGKNLNALTVTELRHLELLCRSSNLQNNQIGDASKVYGEIQKALFEREKPATPEVSQNYQDILKDQDNLLKNIKIESISETNQIVSDKKESAISDILKKEKEDLSKSSASPSLPPLPSKN